jgi:NAD+-dependent protein deacetylase sirtuin 4
METESARRRYWERSFVGWPKFSSTPFNGAHEGAARLLHRGWVSHVLTQNVDRLHQKAGAHDVLEIHGTTHRQGLTHGLH